MYHLILTACLTGNSGECLDILLPEGDGATLEACQAEAARISADWITNHPGIDGGTTACLPNADIEAVALREIAPGVLFRQGIVDQITADNAGRIANLSVVIGDDSVAVIDTGSSRAEGQALYAAIRRVTDKPISHAILTHMHPDHSLGASVFSEAGAMLVASDRLPPSLEARAQTYLDNMSRILGPNEMIGTNVVIPQTTVEQQLQIDLGRRILQLQAVPTAHTDNDLTVRDMTTNTLFTGDLVFRGLTPVVDGSLNGWLHWLGTPPEEAELIVPGHGEVSTSFDEAVADEQRLLTGLRDSVRAAIDRGESMTDAVPQIVTEMQPFAQDWSAFAETIARDATAGYKELEWE